MAADSVVLRELLDRELIKELRFKYCRFLDLQQWDDLRTLFTEDAELTLAGNVRLTGPDAYVERMKENFKGASQVIHHCVMPEIVFESSDRCRCVWGLFSYLDRATEDGRQAFKNYSYYAEECVLTGVGWKIASLRLLRIRSDREDVPIRPESGEALRSVGRSLSEFLGLAP